MRRIKTVCPRDCYDTCFMEVLTDETNKPVKVVGDRDNPVTQGFLCPRGVMDIKRTYSRERVLYPHKRVGNKAHGEFEKVSWEEALDDSILHLEYSGNMGLFTMYLPQRLFYALGASRTDYSICSKSGHEALALHYGLTYGVEPNELPEMKLIVYWGFNSAVSAPHIHALSLKARKKGGLTVAVDPRTTLSTPNSSKKTLTASTN